MEFPERFAEQGLLLAQERLAFFKLADAPLISSAHCVAVGRDDAIYELADASLDARQLGLDGFTLRGDSFQSLAPSVLKDVAHQSEQRIGGAHAAQKIGECGFDLVARNGLAVLGAALRRAEVIRIVAVSSFRKAPLVWLAALPASHKATQWKREIDVLAGRSLRVSLQAALDRLKRLEADERLVLSGKKLDAPIGQIDVAA